MIKLQKFLFFLLVIFLPSQFGYHFWPDFSFVNGIRIDYLSPTLYLTDVLIVLLVATNLKSISVPKKPAFGFFLFALLNTGFSVSPLLSLYKWVKICEIVVLGIFVYKNKKMTKQVLMKALPISLLWLCSLAVLQWFHGGSLNGIFYYLGERRFTVNTPGIALSKIGSVVTLRPYSTLPHPNALAGFVAVALLLFRSITSRVSKIQIVVFSLSIFVILLTESFSTWFALVVVLLFNFSKRKTAALYSLSLLSPIAFSLFNLNFLPKNILERVQLSIVSGKIISKALVFGVGLGNFIGQISQYLYGKIQLLQPVHNIPLLVFSETGVVGSLLFFMALMIMPLSPAFSVVFVTSLFDHYWITLQSPMLLLAIVVGLSFS